MGSTTTGQGAGCKATCLSTAGFVISAYEPSEHVARRPTGGVAAMLKGLNSVQATCYLEITDAKTTSCKFLFG